MKIYTQYYSFAINQEYVCEDWVAVLHVNSFLALLACVVVSRSKQVDTIISPDSFQTSSGIYALMSLTLAPITEFLVNTELTYLPHTWFLSSVRAITHPEPKITTKVGQTQFFQHWNISFHPWLFLILSLSSFHWKCQSHQQSIRK